MLKTGKNFIVAWPEDLAEIYWILRLLPGTDGFKTSSEDFERAKRNRPAFIKMYEDYLKAKQTEGKSR